MFHLFAERLQNDLSRVEEPAGIGDADRNFNREVQFAANGYGGFSQFCGGAAIDIQRGGVSPAGGPQGYRLKLGQKCGIISNLRLKIPGNIQIFGDPQSTAYLLIYSGAWAAAV